MEKKTVRRTEGHGRAPEEWPARFRGGHPKPFPLSLDYFGITRPGSARPNNEDSLLLGAGPGQTLFAVADGIGGHRAGEVASAMAVEALEDLGPADPLEGALWQAHSEIVAAQREEGLAGMGTTVVAVRFSGSAAEVAHVGDSRAYLMRGGWLRPVTEDHSLVNELLRSGVVTPAQAAGHPWRNVVVRALGAGREPRMERKSFEVAPGDRVVLCSDGLSDVIPKAGIVGLLEEHAQDPKGAARGLAAAAFEAGGTDDVSVVVVDVNGFAEVGRPRTVPRRGGAW